MPSRMTRRDFVTTVSSAAALGALSPHARPIGAGAAAPRSKVVIVRTDDRKKGVAELVKLLEVKVPKGQNILLKPNFNTADPAPGSTHNDTLRQLIAELFERGARGVTIGESSGPPVTKKVMEDKGVFDLASEMKVPIVNFEELADADWVPQNPPGSHWPEGFAVPRVVASSPYTVSTCCLKTHGFGGVLSMSLKLAVGLTPKRIRQTMHRSQDMRRMIAEINTAYRPAFIVMDGVDAFTDGGPSQGTKVAANVFVGGTDRVAVDAVGVAVLKELGSNAAIMEKKIFEQEQIQRAVELKLGITGADQIELVAADPESQAFAAKIQVRLAAG
jgi:uncharacterized protein (DUF362 family)